MLRIAVLILMSFLASSVHAQRRLYTRPNAEAFRLADANEHYFVLERDRTPEAQELLVLQASDGAEVLRVDGIHVPTGTRSVMETWDTAIRPYLAGGMLLTFNAAGRFVGRALPGGVERFSLALDPARMTDNALIVTPTRFAWVDETSLRIFDTATGQEQWRAAFRPWGSGGRVALADDGSVAALNQNFEVIVWNARGVEQARVHLAPDYSTSDMLFRDGLVVVVGGVVHIVDVRTQTLLIETPASQQSSAAFFGSELIVANHTHISAVDPRTLQPRWRTRMRGHVIATLSAILVQRENGILTRLDPATGQPNLTLSVGEPVHRFLYRGRSTWGIAAHADHGEDILLVRDASNFTAYTALPAITPTSTVRGTLVVNGRARSGVEVQVGDQRILTQRGGRFTTTLSLEGPIRIHVPRDELIRRTRLPCASEATILFDPAEPNLILRAGAYGYECDTACHCD